MLREVAIGIAALSLIGCNSGIEVQPEVCPTGKGWLPVDDFVVGEGYFIPIFVDEDGIMIQRSTSLTQLEFESYLRQQSELQFEQDINPYIMVSSDSKLNCKTFMNVVRIVNSHFDCSTSDQCIWAFGHGLEVLPLGIPTPLESKQSPQ